MPAFGPTDVRALVDGGMTIGFHTRGHHPLPTLDDDKLADALAEGRLDLEEVVGERLKVVGYPHGRADSRVAAAARRAGYCVGYTGNARAVQVGDDALLLGRIDPSYRSLGHFALQLVHALARSRPLAAGRPDVSRRRRKNANPSTQDDDAEPRDDGDRGKEHARESGQQDMEANRDDPEGTEGQGFDR